MRIERLSTGNADLDELLGGGLEYGTITQVYGEPGCGKSTICIMAAVSCIKSGKSVIFIDTEGFSIERFAQVAGEGAEGLAERLYLYEPTDFEQQGVMIWECERLINAADNPAVGLLVMDSATALYRTELEIGRGALRRLARHMVKLLGLGKKYGIPVLVSNQVFMDPERGMYQGLGGTALEHISKAILRIDKQEGCQRICLQKHRSRPKGRYLDFEITEPGLRKV